HPARNGRRHFDRRLLGHHFNDDVVLSDRIARLDAPTDNFRLYRALAEIGQFEYITAHAASITPFSACAMRAGPGKYSHSKAWGYGLSEPLTLWMGASRFQNHASCTVATNAAPTPPKRVAS